MLHLNLSETDLETIAEALDDPSIDERAKRKLLALRMHALNVPHAAIARTSEYHRRYCLVLSIEYGCSTKKRLNKLSVFVQVA